MGVGAQPFHIPSHLDGSEALAAELDVHLFVYIPCQIRWRLCLQMGTTTKWLSISLLFAAPIAAQNPDFDGDGTVDFEDFFLFADSFGTSLGDPGFNSKHDLNGNNRIDFDDFFVFSDRFGEKVESEFFLGEIENSTSDEHWIV